jgi:hypothetical protein
MKTGTVIGWLGAVSALAVCLVASRPLRADQDGRGALPGAPISPKDTIALFNGKDLSNFYSWVRDTQYEDPRKIFNVETENGQPVLHITGDGYGGLITRNAYTNYHLIAEYRWGDRMGRPRGPGPRQRHSHPWDRPRRRQHGHARGRREPVAHQLRVPDHRSGVGDLLVLAGNDANEQPLDIGATVEVDMRPCRRRERHDRPAVLEEGRRAETDIARRRHSGQLDEQGPQRVGRQRRARAKDVDTPGLGWTRVEYIADGDKLTYIVNGTVVMEASNITPTAGKIQIQTEQAEISYRKIELQPSRSDMQRHCASG